MARKAAFRPALVAVEAQDRLARHRPQKGALIGGERCAERRDDVGEPGFADRDRVDIAFHDNDRAAVVCGFAGAMMIEQQRAFVEKRSLRRIEIFRLGSRLHRPAAEGDDAARAVVDREHHPVAEPVVGHGDVLPVDQQARLDHLLARRRPWPRAHRAERIRSGDAKPSEKRCWTAEPSPRSER